MTTFVANTSQTTIHYPPPSPSSLSSAAPSLPAPPAAFPPYPTPLPASFPPAPAAPSPPFVTLTRHAISSLPAPSCDLFLVYLRAVLQNPALDRSGLTLIDASGHKIVSKSLAALLDLAVRLNVHTLDLGLCDLTTNATAVLAKHLSRGIPTLRELDLRGNSDCLRPDSLPPLLRALLLSPLHRLNLTGTRLRDDGLRLLAAILLAPSSSPSPLRDLNLADNQLTPAGLEALVRAFLTHTTAIFPRPLSSSSSSSSPSSIPSPSLPFSSPSSPSLPFYSPSLPSIPFSTNLPGLQRLSLTHNPQLGPSGASLLASWLSRPDCFLTALYLGDCGIGEDGAGPLFDAICQRNMLTLLALGNSKLGSGKGPTLVGRLLARCGSLRELYLMHNGFEAATLAPVIELGLSQNTTLRVLDLEGNALQCAGAKLLFEELSRRGKSEETLHSLNLTSNGIASKGMTDVFLHLARNVALKTLQLGKNVIGDSVVPFIQDCFRTNNRLWSLDISMCKLSSENVLLLINDLSRSYSLLKFEFLQAKLPPKKPGQPPSVHEDLLMRVQQTLVKNIQLLNNRGHHQRSAVEVIMQASRQNMPFFDFSHTPLASIPPSMALLHHSLVDLVLFDCSLIDISALLNPATPFLLKRLVLRKNCLASIPEHINRLVHLEYLDLADNRLSSLPDQLGHLIRLQYLDLSTNQFALIPVCLSWLKDLRVLYLRDNNIQAFPVQFVSLRGSLVDIDLEDNTLAALPASVLRNKKRFVTPSSLRRLFEYLATLSSSGQAPSQRVKLMFVGDENQGKTSLMNALKESFFSGLVSTLFSSGPPTSTVATDGIDITQMQADDITFCCWDYAGQEVFYSTHQFFLTSGALYLVCFNMAKHDAKKIDYWINCVRSRSQKAPIILVGTHADKVTDEQIVETKNRYLERYRAELALFASVSSENRSGVSSLRKKLIETAGKHNLYGAIVPRSFLLLEAYLLSLQEAKVERPPFITRAEFEQIARTFDIAPESIPQVLSFFTESGVCVWFPQVDTSAKSALPRRRTKPQATALSDLIFLDPQFLPDLLGTIVTFKHRFINRGILMGSDLHQIWKQYPQASWEPLIALLEKFEVFHPIPSPNDDELRYLVPFMLPSTIPADADHIFSQWSTAPIHIGKIFRFSFMPPGFFGRLLIRLLSWQNLVMIASWRTGAIVQYAQECALLDFDPFRSRLGIYIRARSVDISTLKLPAVVAETTQLLVEGWFPNVALSRFICCSHCLINAASSGAVGFCLAQNFRRSPVESASDPSSAAALPSSIPAPGTMPASTFSPGNPTPVGLYPQLPPTANAASNCALMPILQQSATACCDILTPSVPTAVAGEHAEASQVDIFEDIHLFPLQEIIDALSAPGAHLRCPRHPAVELAPKHMAPDLALTTISHVVDLRTIELGRVLGQGGFANVFKAVWQGIDVAVKVYSDQFFDENSLSSPASASEIYMNFQQEASVMSQLVHPNLTVLHGVSYQPLALIMEFAACGSLDSVLKNPEHRSSLTRRLRLRMATDIASGMQFLHGLSPPIIHRDLKSPNILICSLDPQAPVVAQVSDFGTSAIFLHSFRGRVTFCPYWCAPEIFMGRDAEYGVKVDVYAFAIILWELLTLMEPFTEYDEQFKDSPTVVFEEAVINGLRPTIPEDLPAVLVNLIQFSWHVDPESRPPFKDILNTLKLIVDY